MEAFWASLHPERPSGDDPRQVALALSRFFADLRKNIEKSRALRWRTPLFRELDPEIRSHLETIQRLLDEILPSLPPGPSDKLEELKQRDQALRKATLALEQEERLTDLPTFESPKLNQFNYFFEGWRRGLLPVDALAKFVREYRLAVEDTRREIEQAQSNVNPRESEEEKDAVEQAVAGVEELRSALAELTDKLPNGPGACEEAARRILQSGQSLGSVFHALEQCAPLTDPCPFCGGALSLSGRCRSCGRRLPHLEESAGGKSEITSSFLSNNCRAVDLALLRWEAEPENTELWRTFQEAVRTFAQHVVTGRQSLEMLATAVDRPIDSQHEMRLKEVELKEVGDAFQSALTLLSKYSQPTEPPLDRLDGSWREPLLAAELKLQELERSATPNP